MDSSDESDISRSRSRFTSPSAASEPAQNWCSYLQIAMPLFPTPKDLCKHELKEFIGHKDEVNSVSFSSDFLFVVTGSDDERVRLFNVKTKEMVIKLKGHEGAVKSVAVSPCDKFFASGSFDKTARIWRTSNGSCLHILEGHRKSVEVVSFSPGSAYLCTGSWDRSAILWCVQTGCLMKRLSGHDKLVQCVAFSHNFEFLVTGSWDFTVKVWTLDHAAYRDTIARQKKQLTAVNTSLAGSDDRESDDEQDEEGDEEEEESNLDETECDNNCRTLTGHTGNVHSVAFSKIGMLASGSWDRTIRLWNPWNGKLLRLLEGHIGWVKAVTFSPDCIFVASAADDDYVKVWDIPSGDCINTLEGNTDLAQYCAFTSNGLLVTSGAAVSKVTKVKKENSETEAHEEDPESQVMAILHQ